MRHVRGFTLIELLLAISLSALILVGAYQFFNLIQKAGQMTKENSQIQSLVAPLYYILLRDIESADLRYAPIDVTTDADGNQVLELYTHNCFYFKGICLVKYWVYEKVDSDLHYLVRSEVRLNSLSSTGVDVPLTSKVSKIEVKVPSSDGWNKVSGKITDRLINVILYLSEPEGELPLVFVVRS